MLERPAKLAQHTHGEETGHPRALVIAHAAANHRIVFLNIRRAELRVLPAVANRHHVQMRNHANGVLLVAQGDGAEAAVMILHIKSIITAAFERIIEHLAAIGAKRRAGLRQIGTADGGNARNPLQLGYIFRLMRFNPGRRLIQQLLISFIHQ